MNDLFISTQMPGKMKGIPCLSTSSLNNTFCQKSSSVPGAICESCYSRRNLKMYKSANQHYVKNGEILSRRLLTKVPVINARYFRFNAHGELINLTHLKNLYTIAMNNPKTAFTLWTKRVNFVHRLSKPKNLILIYSEMRINKIDLTIPKLFDKVFAVYTRRFTEDNHIHINCKNSCLNCLLCYDKTIGNKTRHIKELRK